MKLKSFRLRINNPKTINFYTKILGMKLKNTFEHIKGTLSILNFENQDYCLELFHEKEDNSIKYSQKPDDNYWKHSLFIDNIQRVNSKIKEYNIPIGEPYQFGDIGYLSHTKDIEDHQIEFIQKTFKQNTVPSTPKENYPLLENPVLGLLTIRTKDPIKSIQFYEDICGMKLHARMYVKRSNGFTLYFLGSPELTPPSLDIDALENREWMYQQNHLFIEIQHYWGSEYDDNFILNHNHQGCQLVKFEGDLLILKNKLLKRNIPFLEKENQQESKNEIHFYSVDNLKILATEYKN